jgi:hypothetical protein
MEIYRTRQHGSFLYKSCVAVFVVVVVGGGGGGASTEHPSGEIDIHGARHRRDKLELKIAHIMNAMCVKPLPMRF